MKNCQISANRTSWVGKSLTALFFTVIYCSNASATLNTSEPHYALKLLGKFVFFDNISEPARQSCASCHAPEVGGTNENARVNMTVVAVPGANFHTSGGLKPPTNAYASLVPEFQECNRGAFRIGGFPGRQFCGGNFWDGRSEGTESPLFTATEHIGTEVFQGVEEGYSNDFILEYSEYFGPTSDQALNPMPNPVEQNIERQAVCEHVANSEYSRLYEIAWGESIDCSQTPAPYGNKEAEFDISFKRLALAIGAWQASSDLNSFSSKRDNALRAELACSGDPEFSAYYDHAVCTDQDYLNSPGTFPLVGFTEQENLGHDLFYNTAVVFGPPGTPPPPAPFPELPVTNCSFCHISDTVNSNGTGIFEGYTDDAYHNIGTPANPEVPADPQVGISGHIGEGNPGFFRTPTLRNVDKRPYNRFIKAYTHNGWFKSLESLVHFYNTARVDQATAQSFGITQCPDSITSERRALRANCWPAPEWPGIAPFVGNLGMNSEQEAALVAYLKTLTDEHTPEEPQLTELYDLIGDLQQ